MKVDYRQENTCYKETTLMTWSEARRTCWVWGGELAFPLTGASYCSETGIYREQTEEVGLGGQGLNLEKTDFVYLHIISGDTFVYRSPRII